MRSDGEKESGQVGDLDLVFMEDNLRLVTLMLVLTSCRWA